MTTRLHVIPVGGLEPLHTCHESCWCQPLVEPGVVVHNAKDMRETRERHGHNSPDETWVIVNERIPE